MEEKKVALSAAPLHLNCQKPQSTNPLSRSFTVDDINPALPIIRNISQ